MTAPAIAAQTATSSFSGVMSALNLTPYPEQETVVRHLAKAASQNAVGFIEAPTATGKTLAIAYHVVDHCRTFNEPYIVAVPTIELGHQTLAAIRRVLATLPGSNTLNASLILGRQEFLSPAGLSDLASTVEPAIANVINEWIENGAPGRTPSHPAWTRDGLERALEFADIQIRISDALRLGASEAKTPAGMAYDAQFNADSAIYVVSHAMLAHDLLTRFIETSRERRRLGMTIDPSLSAAERWLLANQQRLEIETGDEGRLPDYRRLLVDEAHLLRDSFDNALSTGISITSLVRQVQALAKSGSKIVPPAALREIKSIRDTLIKTGAERSGSSVALSWTAPDLFSNMIDRLNDALSKVKTNKAPADCEHEAYAVSRARYAIQESLRAQTAVSTVFDWSPVESFPTITVGRRNLGAEFALLWGRLKSAALVSATLYTDNVEGPKIDHMANRLCVPMEKRMVTAPIAATWIREPVTVMLPTVETANYLQPEDDDMRLVRIAGKIAGISSETVGTLVLTTRRADTHALSNRIAHLVGPNRVIDGTSTSLSNLKREFISKSRLGLKPIWIAQGPAWTGLDLPDDVLDTLVITRLPFPRPTVTNDDQPNLYGAAKIAQMAMTFKQGVGRLVRSRNASPKTLWMLDGRIMLLGNKSGVLGPLNLLRTYKNKSF